MDVHEGWTEKTTETNPPRTTLAENTLNAVTPACAEFAAWWDAEADRRAKLRTPENLKKLMDAQSAHNSAQTRAANARSQRQTARKGSSNPLARKRRAARAADKAAREHQRAASAALKAAQAAYPATLTSLAVRAHTAHTVPATAASWWLSTPDDWTVWPATLSAALITVNAGALWLGRRSPSAQAAVDDGLTPEERRLMQRLDPSWWTQHAGERGLEGTVTGTPEITSGGLVCQVRLDGKWTLKALRAADDNVRNLLGLRTATRMRITSGRQGGWAVLQIATRSAADGVESTWSPDRMPPDPLTMSLGLDTETGEEVLIPFDERMLIAGASGTGKSWSTRPLMATAHLRGDFVLIDGKGEEANEWDGICRCAVDFDEIDDVIDEIHDEMNRRKADMKSRRISVWDRPQLTVLVDEGQVVLASVGKDRDRLQRLIELSSLGRSRGIVLWWATQKPTMSGAAPGVHNLIAPNLLTRFCLRVADAQEAQTALDDCADYLPQKIDRGKEWRGHGYLKDYGPRMIRTWTLNNDGVRALPPKVWNGGTHGPERPSGASLHLVKDDAPTLQLPAPGTAQDDSALKGLTDNQARVMQTIRAGASTNAEIARATGLNKGSVARAIDALAGRGLLAKDGTILRPGRLADSAQQTV